MVRKQWLFVACIIALVATAFGFGVRQGHLSDIGRDFNLTETQKGALGGAGLFPFALSIIFFSLIVDRIGYGRCMAFAFFGHVASAILTLAAKDFTMLYIGTLLFALANGTVEAVINPVTATLFPKEKTHYLSILHSGWPGGNFVGILLAIAMGSLVTWQNQLVIFLLPTVVYGLMMLGTKFPVHERVAAGVSYKEMLAQFGWGSCFIVVFFTVYAFDAVFKSTGVYGPEKDALLAALIIAAAASACFGAWVKSFGQPLFFFLLLVMILLATTELGVDSWVSDLWTAVLAIGQTAGSTSWLQKNAPLLILAYTFLVMFVLRFFAGPIVHRITPLGLLAVCAAIASLGLVWLSTTSVAFVPILLGATAYGVGKTFFWPCTLGVVSEQFPKGGAMMINAIAGVGMISVGTLGGTFLGAVQDHSLDVQLKEENPAIHAKIAAQAETSYMLVKYHSIDKAKAGALPAEEQSVWTKVYGQVKQGVLSKFAIMPGIMCLCYIFLILYFKSKGGYAQVEMSAAPGGEAPPPPPT